MTVTELDAGMIQELLSRSKARGEYDAELKEFLASGKAGVEISLTEGRFAGKGAKNVKIGFDNARKKTSDQGLVHPGGPSVQVVAVVPKEGEEGEEHLYLINRQLVGGTDTNATNDNAGNAA